MTATLTDQRDELGAIVAQVAAMVGTTREKGAAYLALLRDAQQAQRLWAADELAAIEAQGAQHRFKVQAKRRGHLTATVGRGRTARAVDMPTLVSVRRGGEWTPLEWPALTPAELDGLAASRRKARDGATDRLVVLDRLRRLCERHPTAATLGAALAADGVTLAEAVA